MRVSEEGEGSCFRCWHIWHHGIGHCRCIIGLCSLIRCFLFDLFGLYKCCRSAFSGQDASVCSLSGELGKRRTSCLDPLMLIDLRFGQFPRTVLGF